MNKKLFDGSKSIVVGREKLLIGSAASRTHSPASTTYETNKGPKWVLIWGLCGRPIWAPVSFCKRFSDGTNMIYQ